MMRHSTGALHRTEKTCPACLQLLPIDAFARDRSKPDGHSTYCRACKQLKARIAGDTPEQRTKRRQKGAAQYAAARVLLNTLKSRPCLDCDGVFPPYVMHYDHRDPTQKRLAVSYWTGAGAIPQMLAEIARCDLVCANCHAIRTHQQRQAGLFKGKHRPRRDGTPGVSA